MERLVEGLCLRYFGARREYRPLPRCSGARTCRRHLPGKGYLIFEGQCCCCWARGRLIAGTEKERLADLTIDQDQRANVSPLLAFHSALSIWPGFSRMLRSAKRNSPRPCLNSAHAWRSEFTRAGLVVTVMTRNPENPNRFLWMDSRQLASYATSFR